MGLFWTLKPAPGQRAGLRFIPRIVTSPINYKLTLHDGHASEAPLGRVLAEQAFQRLHLSEKVERIPVKEGRLRGTLFRPKGPL
jgi:Acyl-CoA thioester hydrolase/BAAT N-terminal region